MPDDDAATVVALWAAPIPVVGWLAWHHGLVVVRGAATDRWEVWQRPAAGGEHWGHLHRNLMAPDRGVGGGPSRVIRVWSGDSAGSVAARIEGAPRNYPWRYRYRVLPGPNSNTFAQWAVGYRFALGWKGWGRGTAVGAVSAGGDAG